MTDRLSQCCLAAVEMREAAYDFPGDDHSVTQYHTCTNCDDPCGALPVDELSDDQMERAAAKWAGLMQCPQCSDRCVGGFYSGKSCAVCGQETVTPAFLSDPAAAFRLLDAIPYWVIHPEPEVQNNEDSAVEGRITIGKGGWYGEPCGDLERAITLAVCHLRAHQIEPIENEYND